MNQPPPSPGGRPPPASGGDAWPAHDPAGRTSGAGAVLAAVLVVALLGMAGMVGVAAAVSARADRPGGPGGERHSSPPSPATTTTADAASTTTLPAPARAAAPDPILPGTILPGAAAVPPAAPQSQPAPVLRLGDNPLFRGGLGLAAVDCRLPGFGSHPDVQARYYRAALDCLDRAWLPVLLAAGLPAQPPRLEVPTGPFDSACGSRPANAAAFYCKGTIYLPPRYFSEVERLPPSRPSPYLGVLAHEYGHHVQELAGVMEAVWERRYEAGVNSPAGLDLSRRNELQATCFAGMFYASTTGRGSVTRAMVEDARTDQARRGDHPETGLPRDHGTPYNNAAWFTQGARLNQTYQCNTWQAPAGTVS